MNLFKLAADRITKQYIRGEISEQALNTLKNKGMIRSIDKYLDGFKKGSKNIAKQRGYSIRNPINDMEEEFLVGSGGYVTIDEPGLKKTILVPDSQHISVFANINGVDTDKAKILDALFTRHEAYETGYMDRYDKFGIMALNKTIDRPKANSFLNKTKMFFKKDKKSKHEFKTQLKKMIRDGQVRGFHGSQAVLGKELYDAQKVPYPELKKTIADIRGLTGEKNILTNILYKDPYSEGITKKDIKRLDKQTLKQTNFYSVKNNKLSLRQRLNKLKGLIRLMRY